MARFLLVGHKAGFGSILLAGFSLVGRFLWQIRPLGLDLGSGTFLLNPYFGQCQNRKKVIFPTLWPKAKRKI